MASCQACVQSWEFWWYLQAALGAHHRGTQGGKEGPWEPVGESSWPASLLTRPNVSEWDQRCQQFWAVHYWWTPHMTADPIFSNPMLACWVPCAYRRWRHLVPRMTMTGGSWLLWTLDRFVSLWLKTDEMEHHMSLLRGPPSWSCGVSLGGFRMPPSTPLCTPWLFQWLCDCADGELSEH